MARLSTIVTKLKNNIVSILMTGTLLICLVFTILYAIKYFGTGYAEEKMNKQLEQAGLAPFIHYEGFNFDPFTFTPSLNYVSFGNKHAPWLKFARISFNSLAIHYPNLDVDFWIQKSPISTLSRGSGYLMRLAGLNSLLGKGYFHSQIEGDKITSTLYLDIKDAGKLTIKSKLTLMKKDISISELRTDLLASIALGQPEAMLILYGEGITIESLEVDYTDGGLVYHVMTTSDLKHDSKQHALMKIRSGIDAYGLASRDSQTAKRIAATLLHFMENATRLSVSLSPVTPISVKDLTLSAHNDSLYQDSNMSIKTTH